MTDAKRITIHTDGACSGNPGPGGWGAILEWNGSRKELSGGEARTTNNRMELMAAIEALGALKGGPHAVDLYTDSSYVKDGISGWIHGWKRNGWKTAAKKPVKNAELWQALDAATQRHNVTWHWLKGHAGHEENERADELARGAMAPFKKSVGEKGQEATLTNGNDGHGTPAQRYAAYAVIGAVIGAVVVWFVADAVSFATLGSGLIGGAVAGTVAGFVRSRAGLDQ